MHVSTDWADVVCRSFRLFPGLAQLLCNRVHSAPVCTLLSAYYVFLFLSCSLAAWVSASLLLSDCASAPTAIKTFSLYRWMRLCGWEAAFTVQSHLQQGLEALQVQLVTPEPVQPWAHTASSLPWCCFLEAAPRPGQLGAWPVSAQRLYLSCRVTDAPSKAPVLSLDLNEEVRPRRQGLG